MSLYDFRTDPAPVEREDGTSPGGTGGESTPEGETTEGRHAVTSAASPAIRGSSGSEITQQIIRDMCVLREDEKYHVPSREFYEQRIAAYKELLNEYLSD